MNDTPAQTAGAASRSQFHVKGVAWRRILDWSARNVPFFIEPIFIHFWGILFFCAAGEGRKALIANLRLLFPRNSGIRLRFKALRVICNYAWTLSESARVRAGTAECDWQLEGIEKFDEICAEPGGIIILTAHMGSYDLGAQLFADKIKRNIVMVRAPEPDPATQKYAQERGWAGDAPVATGSSSEQMLSLDLLAALRRGEALAIQGDRCPEGMSVLEGKLGDTMVRLPGGPFILALTSGAPILPLFVIRLGRRRYLLKAGIPIRCQRTGRDRQKDLGPAVSLWAGELTATATMHWAQWFCFEKISGEQQ